MDFQYPPKQTYAIKNFGAWTICAKACTFGIKIIEWQIEGVGVYRKKKQEPVSGMTTKKGASISKRLSV